MRGASLKAAIRNDEGAVAATYALALTGLILIAGVGFDYGRLAAMDSELQNGADQAALAGATQLNGASDACQRAADAARAMVSNTTVIANNGNAVTIATETACDATGNIKFWQDKNRATAATSGTNAHFIEVTVDTRSVDYAFTPIAGLIHGASFASAMAGLGSSVCKVPPVFLCNPAESTDAAFTVANYIGFGIRLIANTGSSNYTPGNFGYLESNAGNGAQAIAQTLGRTNIPGDCISVDSVSTKPGQQVSVLDALNTRFDVYANGLNQACGGNNGLCPPSANTRKDLTHKGASSSCALASGNGAGWQEATKPYLPASATVPLLPAQIAQTSPMGYPRDMCHAISASGTCSGGQIGNGTWDSNAYFKTNSQNYANNFDPSVIPHPGSTNLRRYDVYKYEAANAGTRLQNQSDGSNTAISQPYCVTPGVAVGGVNADRRVLSVAIVNCQASGVQGSTSGITPVKWIDVFLTEPSVNRARTAQSDVYVEVVGATTLGGGSTAAQLIRRDVPYLVN